MVITETKEKTLCAPLKNVKTTRYIVSMDYSQYTQTYEIRLQKITFLILLAKFKKRLTSVEHFCFVIQMSTILNEKSFQWF